jgi:hypothetical protein
MTDRDLTLDEAISVIDGLIQNYSRHGAISPMTGLVIARERIEALKVKTPAWYSPLRKSFEDFCKAAGPVPVTALASADPLPVAMPPNAFIPCPCCEDEANNPTEGCYCVKGCPNA